MLPDYKYGRAGKQLNIDIVKCLGKDTKNPPILQADERLFFSINIYLLSAQNDRFVQEKQDKHNK